MTDPSQDKFGFRVFADSLAFLIDNERTQTPLTVAISAPWGSGKTSVAQMLDHMLRELAAERLGSRPNVMCWFNAWTHGDAEHLGAALAAAVARKADDERPRWRRILAPLPGAMLTPRARWRRRVGVGVLTIVLLGLALYIPPVREWMADLPVLRETAAGLGTAGLVAMAVVLLWPKLFSVAEHAARFVDDPGSEAARGSMTQVREQIGRLIGEACRDGRFILFIDDLERCDPARAVEICEVATQLLSHTNVVTVLVADMEGIARSAQQRYADTQHAPGAGADDEEQQTGRRYLEKVVQIQLTLPPPSAEDMRRLLRRPDPGGGSA